LFLLTHPPCPTLFPYTTLFRSGRCRQQGLLVSLLLLLLFWQASLCRNPNMWVDCRKSYADQVVVGSPLSSIPQPPPIRPPKFPRSEEHTSELQSRFDLVCRLLL